MAVMFTLKSDTDKPYHVIHKDMEVAAFHDRIHAQRFCTMLNTDDDSTLSLMTAIRERFLLKGMSYDEVEAIVSEINNVVENSGALSTYNGTTFMKTFVPKGR